MIIIIRVKSLLLCPCSSYSLMRFDGLGLKTGSGRQRPQIRELMTRRTEMIGLVLGDGGTMSGHSRLHVIREHLDSHIASLC